MTTAIINDAASMQRQRKLLDIVEGRAVVYEARVSSHLKVGDIAAADEAQKIVNGCRTVAIRCRNILMRAQPAPSQEPPRTLVGLTDWLVGLLGRYFPGLPREGWQAVAYWLNCWRPQP